MSKDDMDEDGTIPTRQTIKADEDNDDEIDRR